MSLFAWFAERKIVKGFASCQVLATRISLKHLTRFRVVPWCLIVVSTLFTLIVSSRLLSISHYLVLCVSAFQISCYPWKSSSLIKIRLLRFMKELSRWRLLLKMIIKDSTKISKSSEFWAFLGLWVQWSVRIF